MWHATHELSATQVHHPSINAYQHYSTAQLPHHHVAHHNGNMSKWNIAGQRSSYSLPHPGHTQSNMRWHKYDEKPAQTQPAHRHLSSSTRNLATIPANPSFLHEQRQMYNGSGGAPRQRPASMYDSPNSMPIMPNYHNHLQVSQSHHINGFIPTHQTKKEKEAAKKREEKNGGLRQSPGELVRWIVILYSASVAFNFRWIFFNKRKKRQKSNYFHISYLNDSNHWRTQCTAQLTRQTKTITLIFSLCFFLQLNAIW